MLQSLPLSHRNTITKTQAKFLYAFITEVSIDLPSVICKSLIEIYEYEDKMSHLIHPCLITRLLTHNDPLKHSSASSICKTNW